MARVSNANLAMTRIAGADDIEVARRIAYLLYEAGEKLDKQKVH